MKCSTVTSTRARKCVNPKMQAPDRLQHAINFTVDASLWICWVEISAETETITRFLNWPLQHVCSKA